MRNLWTWLPLLQAAASTREQLAASRSKLILTEKFYRSVDIITRALIPIAIVVAVYLLWRIARNLEKPPKLTEEVRIVRKSLSEMLKENRTRCKMTQEFVAESIGVSRQAVSKWENGTSAPSPPSKRAAMSAFRPTTALWEKTYSSTLCRSARQ